MAYPYFVFHNHGRYWLERRRKMEEEQKQKAYAGEIPPIADKEKKGRKINLPKEEPYVQELTTDVEINIPPAN